MQAPTSKGQGFHKNISLFCDSIVGASIARPLRPCDPARLFGWSRAPPLQWAARCGCDYKRYFGISQWGQGLTSPAFAAAANPKIFPRTVGGPAVQAPTSKRQDFRKNISIFCDFTVGAGLALPAFAVPASLRMCRRSYAGLRCRPLRAKGKAGGEIERVHTDIKPTGEHFAACAGAYRQQILFDL